MIKTLETKNRTQEDKTNDLEFRSISNRENLLFHGIEESQNENCELLDKRFIAENLEIWKDIKIDRAQRLGKPKGRTRPIVVKFHKYRQLELVRVTAGDKSEALKIVNKGIRFNRQKLCCRNEGIWTKYTTERKSPVDKWNGPGQNYLYDMAMPETYERWCNNINMKSCALLRGM